MTYTLAIVPSSMFIRSSRPSWNGLQYNNNCETDTEQITIEQRVLLYRVAYQYITIIII